jgi:polar amino acid transport system substrate-binding protein
MALNEGDSHTTTPADNDQWLSFKYMRFARMENAVLEKLFLLILMLWINCFYPCVAAAPNDLLQGGWYNLDPYQYLSVPGDQATLTGFDVEIQKILFKKLGYKLHIAPVPWKQHLESLKTGEIDYAMGAFYSEERALFSHISIPYRFEENSLFRIRDSPKFRNTPFDMPSFLKKIKKEQLKVGVIEGYRYASEALNQFINDPSNARLLIKSATDNQNLALLLAGEIEGFLADRIVGATIIWREKAGNHVVEERLDSKAPIHLLLSKKSFTPRQAELTNAAIRQLKDSPEFIQVVSGYLYPVLLLETTDSVWFSVMQQLGIIAFALSGLTLAYRYHATLLGTFLLALLPSFGGGILRDILLGRFPVFFLSARLYMLTLLVIVLGGFALMRVGKKLLQHNFFKTHRVSYKTSQRFFDTLLTVTDAIGLAVFTITGILVSLILKADPLWLWGPFFAFLTGAGGGILRDIILKQARVEALHGNLYGEIPIVWGTGLSLYLTYTVYDVDPLKIKLSVMITLFLIFMTRVLVYAYDIPNLFFSKAPPVNPDKKRPVP